MPIFVFDLFSAFLYPLFALPGLFALNMNPQPRRFDMANSTYKIIELVGTSTESWEDAVTCDVNSGHELPSCSDA